MTEKELCEVLQVGRIFVYQCRKKGMPYIQLGTKLIRYDYEEVLQWMKNRRKEYNHVENKKIY